MAKELDVTAMDPEKLAEILAASIRKSVTVEQVLQIAREGNVLSVDGTINLVRYTAWLAGEVSHGR